MNQQKLKSFTWCYSGFPGFPAGGFSGNNHVSPKMGIDFREGAFLHGKGQDIGRTFPAEIAPVIPGYLRILDGQEADLPLTSIPGLRCPQTNFQNFGRVYQTLPIVYLYLHWSFSCPFRF